MLTLGQMLEKLKSSKSRLEKKYPIKSLGLFGSYARNEPAETSDLDLLIEFSKPVGIEFIHLADELEDELHIKVDLVSAKGLRAARLKEIMGELIYV